MLFLILYPFIGALANRFRGGWIGTGHTQWARAIFAVIMGAMLCVGLLNPWALVAIPLMFLGCLPGQGEDQAADTWAKRVGLGLSGTVNFLGIAIGAGLSGAWLPLVTVVAILVGISKPATYMLAQKMPNNLLPFLLGQGFLRGPTEWGEVLFGAVMGLATAILCVGLF